MVFDPIKVHFRLLKWMSILIAVLLPFIVYAFTRTILDVNSTTVFFSVFTASGFGTLLLYRMRAYFDDEFFRYYAKGPTWEYIAKKYLVDRKPSSLVKELTGMGQLERKDIAFRIESGVSEDGLYINVNSLGRILIPWQQVNALRKDRLSTKKGWQETVRVVLVGVDVDLIVPWSQKFDEIVPNSVGIAQNTA